MSLVLVDVLSLYGHLCGQNVISTTWTTLPNEDYRHSSEGALQTPFGFRIRTFHAAHHTVIRARRSRRILCLSATAVDYLAIIIEESVK